MENLECLMEMKQVVGMQKPKHAQIQIDIAENPANPQVPCVGFTLTLSMANGSQQVWRSHIKSDGNMVLRHGDQEMCGKAFALMVNMAKTMSGQNSVTLCDYNHRT